MKYPGGMEGTCSLTRVGCGDVPWPGEIPHSQSRKPTPEQVSSPARGTP